ncbi:C-type lectin domain family 4 member A [Channa argus]|uniref:C-type lectin domain family 4 member A n=1 Tax=Channa argus TaxID=215402 RepID=A0A6G1QXQ5_CHAAH|nr:C-type lectin domain family 4 member A [Channa argus]
MEVEMMEDGDQCDDVGSQEAQPDSEKKLPAMRNSSFRVFTVSLRVLCLLVLAGIITRHILVTLEKNDLENQSQHLIKQLQVTKEKELQSRIDNLTKSYNELQDKIWKLCPEGWKRFGCSCYFKSTERKSWSESRKNCENRESYLVIINNKEEQDFVTELNQHEESWIGLWKQWSETEKKYQWKWLDGSQPTETFWATGEQHPTGFYAAYCDQQGRWRSEQYYYDKNWICEKKICCFL